jgi:hypothetical protein
MNNVLTVIGGIFAFIFLALIAVFIFAAPSWYIWNHIVAPKFDAPLFTFWEAFFTILMIRLMFPNISSKTEKK